LHNSKRLESFVSNASDSTELPPIDSAKKVSIGVASIKEIELPDGSKVHQFEVGITITFKHENRNVTARLDSNEVWEYDGKSIRLTNGPHSWSYLEL
jgi:hypothetical protein